MPNYSESRWGSPSAKKQALLLHGLSSNSQTMSELGTRLADNGFYVISPDLFAHGFSSAQDSSDYSISAYSNHVIQFLENRKMTNLDLIIAHSLGCLITCALPLDAFLKSENSRVILLDPPMELDDDQLSSLKDDMVAEVSNKEPDFMAMQKAHPKWSSVAVATKILGALQCPAETIMGTLEQNKPWSFLHTVPPSYVCELIILGGEKSAGAVFTEKDLKSLAADRPELKLAIVTGASHSIHREELDLVVKVALTGEISYDGLKTIEQF